jgi:hypothetical protein
MALRIGFLTLVLLVAGQARGQTLQLPSYSFFAVSTTVLVPDRGSATIGGSGGASWGRSQFGGIGLLPGQRANGVNRHAGGVNVSATVHDVSALDDALLQNAASRRAQQWASNPGPDAGTAPKEATPASPADRGAADSIAEIQRQRAGREQAQQDEAQGLLERGQRAETEGKPGVARLYYQMAARRASGELREQALTSAAALGPASKPRTAAR